MGQHVALKHLLTFILLHDIISQKIELFMTIPVRTSNPTRRFWVGNKESLASCGDNALENTAFGKAANVDFLVWRS
jgi:hypothetical protein